MESPARQSGGPPMSIRAAEAFPSSIVRSWPTFVPQMKLSPDELDDFLVRSRGAVLVSLDDINMHEPDGPKILDMLADTQHPDPLATILNDRERERVTDAIQQLPEKERLVLTLYYYEELTMKEIGKILKVTESRVCQIHTKAVLHLKERLEVLQ